LWLLFLEQLWFVEQVWILQLLLWLVPQQLLAQVPQQNVPESSRRCRDSAAKITPDIPAVAWLLALT